MESNYISIAEFAKRQGISKSHAYKLMKKPEYQQYLKEMNGRMLISAETPLEIASKPEENASIQLEIPDFASKDKKPEEKVSIPVEADKKPEEEEKPVENANIPEETHGIAVSASADIEYYKKRIETLEAIIADKDKIIQDNTATITLLLERQQELTEKALQVATQAQYLQAIQKKTPWYRRLLGGGKKNEV